MSQEQALEVPSAPLQEAVPDAWRKTTTDSHSISELLPSPPVGFGHETVDSHSHDAMQPGGECKRKEKIANDARQTRARTDAEADTDHESADTRDLNGAISSSQQPHSAIYSYRMRDGYERNQRRSRLTSADGRDAKTASASRLPHAYIHDDFEPPSTVLQNHSLLGRQSASTDTIRASNSRLLPAHLVFDVTKTQVASGQRKDRARVPKPEEPTRGFTKTSAAARFPSASALHSTSATRTLLSPHISIPTQGLQASQQQPERITRGKMVEKVLPRPNTSLGVHLPTGRGTKQSTSRDDTFMSSIGAATAVSLNDLRASWVGSGAASTERSEEPPEITASKMLMTMPPGTRYRYEKTHKSIDTSRPRLRSSSRNSADVSSLDDVNQTRADYKAEISQPDGTPVPAYNRKWPHIVLDTINDEEANERTMSILSVVRKYAYIAKSPAHTKAFSLSQRGYVESHAKGLTEFEPLLSLNVTMTQYAMALKQPIFAHFRTYKALRLWDFAVRRRKFQDRKNLANKIMMQARREHWACVQYVKSECVQLTLDVQEKNLRPSPAGWNVEQLKEDILRRREILQDALDATRTRITEFLEKFFSTISETVSVDKLRSIYKHNRQGRNKKASQIASEDMTLLARVYTLCEHIVCQTATELYNNEVERLLRLLEGCPVGVLNVDAAMTVPAPDLVKIELPHSAADKLDPANLAEIIVTPSGTSILEMLMQGLNTLYLSLSYSMRPRLMTNLEMYIASEVFLQYVSKKPDFNTVGMNSVDYLTYHKRLEDAISSSHDEAIDHCHLCMGHLRGLSAYSEGFVTRSRDELLQLIDRYPREAEQYSAWLVALTKFPAHDADCGALRLKYRRLKLHMQDKLQQEIIDVRFEMFFEAANTAIAQLKDSSGFFVKNLEADTKTFDDLVSLFSISKELDACLEQFVAKVHSCLQQREVILTQYKTTTPFLENPEKKLHVPVLSITLADKMREERQSCRVKMIERHDWHVKLVKEEILRFQDEMNGLSRRVKGPKVQRMSSDTETALKAVQEGRQLLENLTSRSAVMDGVLEDLKLPRLNLRALEDSGGMVSGLEALWEAIHEWETATREMLDTPLFTLQRMDEEARMKPVLEKVARLVEEHSKIPLSKEFLAALQDFEALWPSIRRLANKAMKAAHYNEFLKGDSTEMVHYDFDTLTVRQIQTARHLENGVLLTRVHDKAVEEEQMFAMVDKLRASVDAIALNLCREGESIWVQGIPDVAAVIQDDAMLIASIKASEFRKMVSVELESLARRNYDQNDMVSLLRFCQDSWCALRIAHACKNLPELDRHVYEDFSAAEMKWVKSLAALAMERGFIKLAHIEFAHVLRVQEVVELFTKSIQDMAPFCEYLYMQCSRLRFVPMLDAMCTAAKFVGPGPAVPEATLLRVFPNIHAIRVDFEFRPEQITGAHGESLELTPSEKGSTTFIETLRNFLPSVRRAVHASIRRALEGARDGALFKRSADFTCQTTILVLQLMWSNTLTLTPTKTQLAACREEIETHVQSLFDMYGSSTRASVMQRRKYQSLVIVAHTWRDSLAQVGEGLRDHDAIEMMTQMPCLQVYQYDDKTEELNVHYGPFTFSYGFDFLDGALITPGLPGSWRYNLFLLSCVREVACGFVQSKTCHSEKESTISDLARVFGFYSDTIDCHLNQPVEHLSQCVQGATQSGSWLLLKHIDHLSSSSINVLASAILGCIKELQAKMSVLRPTAGGASKIPIRVNTSPGIFMIGHFRIDRCLPAQLAATLRCKMLGSCLQHRRVVAKVLLQAMGFERSDLLSALLDCAYCILQLRLPSSEHHSLKFHHMKSIIRAAVAILNEDAGKIKASSASSAHIRSCSGEGAPNLDNFDSDVRAIAIAFLQHSHRILNEDEMMHALEAVKQVFEDAGIDVSQAEQLVKIESTFSEKASCIVTAFQQSATDAFLTKCADMMDCLKCDTRPVILVGAPQTGKTHCIKIVSHAITVDLKNPVRDALPKTYVKTIAPMAYFSTPVTAPVAGQDVEVFDQNSIAAFYEYIDWLGRAPVKEDFTFNGRWVVVDCPEAQAVDGLVVYCHQRAQEIQVTPENQRRPITLIETCSLRNAAPSAVALSHIVHFKSECLGWREIFSEWTNKLTLKLEKRTLTEIKDLALAHVPDVISFIDAECKCVQDASSVSVCHAFCSLMHYHFFLGQDAAMRRTNVFVRAAFVFAVIWSYGAALDDDSKEKFDKWFRNRIEKSGVLHFPRHEDSEEIPTLWEIYVSFHVMALRSFADTEKEFKADEKATLATEQTMVIPTQNFRMARLLWQITHTQRQHALFYGPDNSCKSRFVEWIFTIQEGLEKTWNFERTNLPANGTTTQFCEWVASAKAVKADHLFQKPDFHGLFIDDVHLGLEGCKQPTPFCELLRTMMERKSVLNKKLIEDQGDLEDVTFTFFGRIEGLTKGTGRMLNHVMRIPLGMNMSDVQSIAQVNVQPLEQANISPVVKAVLERLPGAMVAVHEWVTLNILPKETDHVLFLWNLDQVSMPLTSLVLLPIWNMETHDLVFRFVWHETMRVYMDRFANITMVQNFRTSINELLTKTLGAQFRRSLRLAAESNKYHVLLPNSEGASSAMDWDLHELTAEQLTVRAMAAIEGDANLHGWITCLVDFPRHLSHVLRIYRPDNKVRGCVLIGPKGSGKLELLQTAAAMCNYQVYVEQPDTSLEKTMQDLRKALATRDTKLFAFCSTGAVLNSALGTQYLKRLMKGHALEEFEQTGSLTVRFAFTHDMGTAIPVDVKAKPLPKTLMDLSKHCTVDWIKGWSDEAILRAIKLRYMTESKDTNVEIDEQMLTRPIPEILFQVHRIVEQAVTDWHDDDMAMVFPPPLLVNDLVSCFLLCVSQRRKHVESRANELKGALDAYALISKHYSDIKAEHNRLLPIVKGARQHHLKVRDDHLNFAKIAARARRIAEDEETSGVRAVLYGDAPGPEIMHEYEVASNAYLTAVRAVADLQSFHMVQLEVLVGFEDLVQLLVEAITIVFAEDIGYDMGNLRNLAPTLQKRVSGFDVNMIGLTTVKRLRSYIADVRFTPEKYFSVNRAAGVLCNWVRAVERYGRAHEWINPASQSNTQQSLDRVREMSKNPIMAIEKFEAGVRATKARETEALKNQEDSRHRIEVIASQIKQSNLILNAITPEKVDWNYKFEKLEECSSTLIGDSALYSAYVTYLMPFAYADRCAILQLLAEALAEVNVATSPQFALESFYAPLELSADATYIRDYSSKCLRENCLAIAACPKIPLLVDPVGHGLRVLTSAAENKKQQSENGAKEGIAPLYRFTISDKIDVRSFLEEARRRNRPALIENAEELMKEILAVMRMHPHLLTGRYQRRNIASVLDPEEVSARLCDGYAIILSTSKKSFLPPADAFFYMSMCDLTPDAEALEEMSLYSIIRHLDTPAHTSKKEFWSANHQMKDTARDIAQKISCTMRSCDIVAQVKADEAALFVSDCKVLMSSRGKLQQHALRGMDVLRGLDYFDTLAKLSATMVATSWEICTMSGTNCFGRGLFTKALLACPSVADLQRGSVPFKNAMQANCDDIVSNMTSAVLQGLPLASRHLSLLILDANQRTDEPVSDFKSALHFFAQALNQGGFGLGNANVACTRGAGTAKLFSKLGWKVFRDSRPHLGSFYATVNASMDLKQEEWVRFAFSPDLSLRLPCTKPSENENTVENLFTTLSLSPHKLSQILEKLTEHKLSPAQVQMKDELQDCAHFLSEFPSTIVSLLIDHEVPVWNAVMQAVLNFTVEDGSGRDADYPAPVDVMIVDSFTSSEQLSGILEAAASKPCWLVAKVPRDGGKDWYCSFVRRMIAFCSSEHDRGTMAKSRLCLAVDAEGVGKDTGVLSDSIAIAAENSADPRQLLGAIIADNFYRGETCNATFWRLAVGLCYMHAVMVRDMQTTASSVFYDCPPLTLVPLLHAARLLAHYEHLPVGPRLRITRMLVGNVCYAPHFKRWNPHLLDLLEQSLSVDLLRDSSQIIVLNVTLEAPDASVARGWKAMVGYSRTLCSAVSVPWQGNIPTCLRIEADFEFSVRTAALLERTQRNTPSTVPDHVAIIQQARALYDLIPKGDILRLDPPQRDLTFFEETLRIMVVQEFAQIQAQAALVAADLHGLLQACTGNETFTSQTLALYRVLSQKRVPAWWDARISAAFCPASWFVQDLKSRYVYFHAKLCSYGMSRGCDMRLKRAIPLCNYSRPKEILDLHLLAWQYGESKDWSGQLATPARTLRFAVVTPPPSGEKKLREFVMDKGIMVSSLVFRCAMYNPQTLCLEPLSHDEHSFGNGAIDSLCLQPVDIAALPTRSVMKAKGWYWSPISVYRRPLYPQAWRKDDSALCTMVESDGQGGLRGQLAPLRGEGLVEGRSVIGGEEELEFVFEVYVRSTIPSIELQKAGVCAFLHAGVQEGAHTQVAP